MSKTTTIIGTGITKKILTTWGGDVESLNAGLLELAAGPPQTFEGLYGGPIEERCRRVLEKAGLCQPGDDVVKKAGSLGNELRQVEWDSAVGYAIRLARELHVVRMKLLQGDGQEAVRSAFELGLMFKEAQMKFRFERPALSGAKRAQSLAQATKSHNMRKQTRAAIKHEAWLHAAANYRKRYPSKGRSEVARMIAQRLTERSVSGSPDYIRIVISRLWSS
jgi:hypothetical protein